MNYAYHYDLLIFKSKDRKILKKTDPDYVYYEKHHIIPKCLGGCNDRSNIAYLTPEEHYVAHQFLVKIHPDNNKLIKAASRMTTGLRRNNKLYGWLKKRHSESMSGVNNHFYGKTHTAEELEKMRIGNTGKKRSQETKDLMSTIKTGISRPKSFRDKLSESKRQSKSTPRCVISTPAGIFESINRAAEYYNRNTATIASKLNSNKEIHKDWYRVE